MASVDIVCSVCTYKNDPMTVAMTKCCEICGSSFTQSESSHATASSDEELARELQKKEEWQVQYYRQTELVRNADWSSADSINESKVEDKSALLPIPGAVPEPGAVPVPVARAGDDGETSEVNQQSSGGDPGLSSLLESLSLDEAAMSAVDLSTIKNLAKVDEERKLRMQHEEELNRKAVEKLLREEQQHVQEFNSVISRSDAEFAMSLQREEEHAEKQRLEQEKEREKQRIAAEERRKAMAASMRGLNLSRAGRRRAAPEEIEGELYSSIDKKFIGNTAGDYDPRECWHKCAPDQNHDSDEVVFLELPRRSNYYKAVAKEFKKTSRREIVKIEAIRSLQRLESYEVRKRSFVRRLGKGKACERWLWHGTGSQTVHKIAHQGFLRQFQNRSMYGEGSYFASAATYSERYCTADENGDCRMFIARVLCGQYHQGHRGLLQPRSKPGQEHVPFESVVNNVDNPTMFIVFTDDQAYPEFVVTFR